jgi:hypothetical protein
MSGIITNDVRKSDVMVGLQIPEIYMPTTGYGEIKFVIQNGVIVDCKTTTSYKIIKREIQKENK